MIIIFLKKFKNTFFTPKYSLENLNKFYKSNNFFLRIMSYFFWFIPSSSQFRYWTNAEKHDHGYEKFIEMNDCSERIFKTILEYSNKNDRILDICCNVGRVLNALAHKGYNNLYGFDINPVAIENFEKQFKFKDKVSISVDYAERYLFNQKDGGFDVTYSLGASLELIPSHFDLIYHISRITKKYHICIINENGHAYPRFWRYEFKKFFSSTKSIAIMKNRTLFILKK